MTKNKEISAVTPFHLLIPAAGESHRMGTDLPKPYLKIGGKAILRHTIEKFLNIKGLESILVIINPDHQALYDDAVQGLNLLPPAVGSDSRKLSVYNGLKEFSNIISSNTILIHDAARPLVQENDIYRLLDTMQNANAATLATSVTDTLHHDQETLDRENLCAIQTPQAFRFGALMEAHETYQNDNNFTDDAGLMRAMGHQVELVPASRHNIKVTTPEDFDMVQAMIATQTETRTASGFDVHAFETEPSTRKLMLGGIEVPHHAALTGHSDADVVLHAVTDALLGTINDGDIGTHFPPSDKKWKDANSDTFLKEAAHRVARQNGVINFLDVTIMAEEPKIGPYRQDMQKHIAEICNIDPARISVKATTTEQLGFTGRKEGMACQALATIALPMTRADHD